MEKNNLTKREVEEAAAEYGITIHPEQYVKTKRGRPSTDREMAAPVFEFVPIPPLPPPPPDSNDSNEDPPPPPPRVTRESPPCHAQPCHAPQRHDQPESPPESPPESESLTLEKLMKMSPADVRALAQEHDIEIKEDGKIVKVHDLKKRIAAKLNLT
jgi:hypothetical protein